MTRLIQHFICDGPEASACTRQTNKADIAARITRALHFSQENYGEKPHRPTITHAIAKLLLCKTMLNEDVAKSVNLLYIYAFFLVSTWRQRFKASCASERSS